MSERIIIIGSGNAGMSAGIAALLRGAEVLILEKASEVMSGGNTKYTAGAMRFCFKGIKDLICLLKNPEDPRIKNTEFGSYTQENFATDLKNFNNDLPLSTEQSVLVNQSYSAIKWLSTQNIKFEPIYERQSFKKKGKYIFWGGLVLSSADEGVGLFNQERDAFLRLGGRIEYNKCVTSLSQENGRINGVFANGRFFDAGAVILACGGFEANEEMRVKFLGKHWESAKVRGTPFNTGDGLRMAFSLGAKKYGLYNQCHATPMDTKMPEFGGLDLPHIERKMFRKICYFLGIMINEDGKRFVDEGKNFRNYTYAQFGGKVLEQPKQKAWQLFDSKVFDLLYDEYHFEKAGFVEAQTIEELLDKMSSINRVTALDTINEYNNSCCNKTKFDPTSLDGKATKGLKLPKTNWAQTITNPPFRAYPVTGGITFTYGGLKVDNNGSVISKKNLPIKGLFACGELVGGVFYNGYPGGSGLTSGLVFGKMAGLGASSYIKRI